MRTVCSVLADELSHPPGERAAMLGALELRCAQRKLRPRGPISALDQRHIECLATESRTQMKGRAEPKTDRAPQRGGRGRHAVDRGADGCHLRSLEGVPRCSH